MRVTLRPVQPDDDAFLCALYGSTRQDELAAWGWGPAERDAFLQLQYRAQQQSFASREGGAEHRIVCREGRPIGRLIISRGADAIQLVDIALLPDARGMGIGSRLIADVLVEADRAGRPVQLQALKGSPVVRLYTRLGFIITADTGVYLRMERPPAPAARE